MKRKIAFTIILVWVLSTFIANAQMRVHLINVGQGCATLIEFPCAAILVDAGGEDDSLFHSTDKLKAYLDSFFETRPDLNRTLQCVYLTHPHKDHTSGVQTLLASYTIKNAVTDGLEASANAPGQTELHRAVQDAEETPAVDDDIHFDAVTTDMIPANGLSDPVIDAVNCAGIDPKITILWGTSATNPGWGTTDFGNENNHSLVIRIEYGSSSFLITGDLELRAITDLLTKYNNSNLLNADVYLAGHHGSRNGTTEELLNKITPQIALIGVGDTIRKFFWSAWRFGHPNKGVLDMLQNKLTQSRPVIVVPAGTGQKAFIADTITKAIYATAWDNNIVLECDDSGHWNKVEKMLVPATVNVNTASIAELETLPGIGPTKAQAIINFRTANGNFSSLQDLDAVPGIGPATLSLIRPYVRF